LLKGRLIEEKQNRGWLIGSILDSDPVSVWNENRRSRSSIVLATLPTKCAPCPSVQVLCVGMLFPGGISSVPTTRLFDPVVAGSTLKMSG
jgi:hypothetical protein